MRVSGQSQARIRKADAVGSMIRIGEWRKHYQNKEVAWHSATSDCRCTYEMPVAFSVTKVLNNEKMETKQD